MDRTGIWEAEGGLESISGFMKSRHLVLRAMKNSFAIFAEKYLKGISSLLEIGSGTGFLEQNWPEYIWAWTQLEQQQAFIDEAKKHSISNCAYVNSSVYELPFSDNTFDAVCGFSSFDCFFDLEDAVAEAIRVLRPGGIFFHMLDLYANDEVLLDYFRKKKIPASIMGRNDMPSPFSRGKNTHLRYISDEKLDKFLCEVGATREEMYAMPDLDFGLTNAYLRKTGNREIKPDAADNDDKEDVCDPIGKLERMEEVTDALEGYFDIFEKYSQIVDANAYFSQRLKDALKRYACPDTIMSFKTTGTFEGERELHHKKAHEQAFYFKMEGGRSDICRPSILSPSYWIYSAAKGRFPRLAKATEPSCYEISVIDCVIARKA